MDYERVKGLGIGRKENVIFKKPFKPAIIFGTVINNEVHILRVTREEYDWQEFFDSHQSYEYHYPDNPMI